VGNRFLFLAYGFVWIIFMLYAWNLSRRQSRLRRELEELKRQVSAGAASSRPPA
jgi:CcmD family protein